MPLNMSYSGHVTVRDSASNMMLLQQEAWSAVAQKSSATMKAQLQICQDLHHKILLCSLPVHTRDSARDMMLLRLTSPKEGRSAVTPQVFAGKMMEPPVSVPKANGTKPAAVAAAGPANQGQDMHYIPCNVCHSGHGRVVGYEEASCIVVDVVQRVR